MICEVGAGLSIIAAVGLDFEAAAARGPGVDVAIGLNRCLKAKSGMRLRRDLCYRVALLTLATRSNVRSRRDHHWRRP